MIVAEEPGEAAEIQTLYQAPMCIWFASSPLTKAKRKTRLNSKDGEDYSPFLISHITEGLETGGVKNFGSCYRSMSDGGCFSVNSY